MNLSERIYELKRVVTIQQHIIMGPRQDLECFVAQAIHQAFAIDINPQVQPARLVKKTGSEWVMTSTSRSSCAQMFTVEDLRLAGSRLKSCNCYVHSEKLSVHKCPKAGEVMIKKAAQCCVLTTICCELFGQKIAGVAQKPTKHNCFS